MHFEAVVARIDRDPSALNSRYFAIDLSLKTGIS